MDDKYKEIARLREHLARAGRLATAARLLLDARVTDTERVHELERVLDEYDIAMMKGE